MNSSKILVITKDYTHVETDVIYKCNCWSVTKTISENDYTYSITRNSDRKRAIALSNKTIAIDLCRKLNREFQSIFDPIGNIGLFIRDYLSMNCIDSVSFYTFNYNPGIRYDN